MDSIFGNPKIYGHEWMPSRLRLPVWSTYGHILTVIFQGFYFQSWIVRSVMIQHLKSVFNKRSYWFKSYQIVQTFMRL